MWAWQFAKMQHAADLHGWSRFISMQDQYRVSEAHAPQSDPADSES
jgi:1-deoxyxylulose-5-phosphate synthase